MPAVPTKISNAARREAEVAALEPLLAAMERRLENGAKWKEVQAAFGVQWRSVSKYGRAVTDRMKEAIECGAEWRRLCREDDLHAKAMGGSDRALLKLWQRDRVRASAHDAHTQ